MGSGVANVSGGIVTFVVTAVFALLSFVLAARTAEAEARRVDGTPSSAPVYDPGLRDELVFLTLDKKGGLFGDLPRTKIGTPDRLATYLDGQRRQLDRFAELRGRRTPVEVIVVLRAHKDVRYARVWEIIDACKRAGYDRWQLRVTTGT